MAELKQEQAGERTQHTPETDYSFSLEAEFERVCDQRNELLAACKALVYFHDTDDTPALDHWANARAAIAKAEGRAE